MSKFTKIQKLALLLELALPFTAFACILGMVPKVDYAADPAGWRFSDDKYPDTDRLD